MKAFQTEKAATYTTKFSSEPKARPSWVPQTTRVNNTNVTIVYDRTYGGYGYYDSMHRWVLYDAIHDAANAAYFASVMDHDPHYAVGNTVVVERGGGHTFFYVLMFIVIVGLGIAILSRKW